MPDSRKDPCCPTFWVFFQKSEESGPGLQGGHVGADERALAGEEHLRGRPTARLGAQGWVRPLASAAGPVDPVATRRRWYPWSEGASPLAYDNAGMAREAAGHDAHAVLHWRQYLATSSASSRRAALVERPAVSKEPCPACLNLS